MSAISSVGVPKEVKNAEGRVAVTPDGVRELSRHGARVHIESGAGEGASIPDEDYRQAGATIVSSASEAWEHQLVIKVKEPQESEFGFLHKDLTLCTYLHLAAYPKVAEEIVKAKTRSFAYETVQARDGSLPLLAPMSEIAGRLAPQMGAQFLERHKGGRGVLLGGASGVAPARVVVIGAGTVGWNAAWIAAGMEATVTLFDKNIERLRQLDLIRKGRTTTATVNSGAIERALRDADLVIGAVLVPGGRAPIVVTEEMVSTMKKGAVIVDVAVDQGGCIATTKETSHSNPVYVQHDVVHYAVGNMPAAVPYTATYALTNATLPYLSDIVRLGLSAAAKHDAGLQHGIVAIDGNITHQTIANELSLPFVDVATALA